MERTLQSISSTCKNLRGVLCEPKKKEPRHATSIRPGPLSRAMTVSVVSHATPNISRFKTIINVDGTWRVECYFPLQETVFDSNSQCAQRNKSKELQDKTHKH
jgi:hypothetical protein